MTPGEIQFLRESFEIACKHVTEGGMWIPITLDEEEGVVLGEPASLADIVRAQSGGAYDTQVVTLGTTCFGEESEAVVFGPNTEP